MGEKLDQYIEAKKSATGFDLRYTSAASAPEKDWREYTKVLSRREFISLLSIAWSN